MDKSKLELKVGLFVFGGIIILGVFILKIGNLKNYGSGYPLRFIFNNVAGIKSGSPVRFSGVDVGEVRRVNVLQNQQDSKTQIEVIAWIRGSQLIPQDSEAYVNTLGLLGERYIELIPPTEYKSFLKSGDSLRGNDPIMLRNWVDEGEKIFNDLKDIIKKLKTEEGTIGKLLNDDKLYREFELLISDIRQAKEGTIGKLIYDDKLYQEIEALISDIRRHPWKLFWKTKEKKAKK